ncbi:retrotransposon protein, putative, ty1-copia subclass [Tanacetum coccineum]
MDGKINTFKARLIAKGYTQTQGVDHSETFSLVASIKAIRILFAIVAYCDYEMWQLDVKTTFLNGELHEKVLHASCIWNLKFDEKIKEYDFDHSLEELVSFTLSMTSGYEQTPSDDHLVAVKNILTYLRRTKDMLLVYGGFDEELDVTSTRSKQSNVALSSTEYGYIVVLESTQLVVLMKKFIRDTGVVPSIYNPMKLYHDN